MKLLLGLTRPTSGSMSVLGRPVSQRHPLPPGTIGSLIEGPSYYPSLTGKENLAMVASYLGLASNRVQHALATVNLVGQENKQVKHYSMGMKQRLGLAMALLSNPALMLLDEPTNGLDPAGVAEIRQLIVTLARQEGVTIIVSSHILSEIEQMADTVGIICAGRLRYQGAWPDCATRGSSSCSSPRPRPSPRSWPPSGWPTRCGTAPCAPHDARRRRRRAHHPHRLLRDNRLPGPDRAQDPRAGLPGADRAGPGHPAVPRLSGDEPMSTPVSTVSPAATMVAQPALPTQHLTQSPTTSAQPRTLSRSPLRRAWTTLTLELGKLRRKRYWLIAASATAVCLAWSSMLITQRASGPVGARHATLALDEFIQIIAFLMPLITAILASRIVTVDTEERMGQLMTALGQSPLARYRGKLVVVILTVLCIEMALFTLVTVLAGRSADVDRLLLVHAASALRWWRCAQRWPSPRSS